MTPSAATTLVLSLMTIQGSYSFSVIRPTSVRPATSLRLEDGVAEMIDMELLRLQNREEYNKKIAAKIQKDIEAAAGPAGIVPDTFAYNSSGHAYNELGMDENAVEMRRDSRLLHKNPQQYCADRCVSTGHCEVLEDMLSMDAMEVMEFCTDCVLSEKEEPCDIPEQMLNADDLKM